MSRTFFMQTERIGFSKWSRSDIGLVKQLWGNPAVTKYICATGIFTENEIPERLETEIANEQQYRVQYFPIFELVSDELIGCCGLHSHGEGEYEIGFHLRPAFWGKGYAREAATAMIDYAFSILHATGLFAGHNPKNEPSRTLLLKLGFQYTGDEYYAPTGLFHPSYQLKM